MFLPVLVLESDGVCVYRLSIEGGETLALQLRHLGHAEKRKSTSQSSEVKICQKKKYTQTIAHWV